MTFLKINNLSVNYEMRRETIYAAKKININVEKGEILGLVGESGSGKSTVGNAIINLIDEPGKVSGGSIILDGTDIYENPENILKLRGKKIGLIFQDPQTSLNPILTIGEQLIETIQTHLKLNTEEAKNKAINLLKEVGIKDAETRFNNYPHQFSGGMRQRVVISLALCCEPELLIADEPTTALDVTVQAQIIELLQDLQEQLGMAIMYITHDLGVICEIADVVHVMYLGKIVESASTKELFHNPLHPYTQRLLASIPKLGASGKGTKLDAIRGNVPVPLNLPPQCGFQSRCNEIIENVCDLKVPDLVDMGNEHYVRCFLHSEEEEKTYA